MKITINEFDVGRTIKSMITAAGDLMVGSAAGLLTIISAPTTGQLLTGNSAHAKKMEWMNPDGWIPVSDTWAYASATTITVPAGALLKYTVGDKIKLTQTTAKYFYIVAVTDTLLTITAGTSYTLTNATIETPYFSHSMTPMGFPGYFTYTPTGVSAANATLTGRFTLKGNTCIVDLLAEFAGAITFTTMPTIPITASANFKTGLVATYAVCGWGGYIDNGTNNFPNGIYPSVLASGTIVTLSSGANGTAMSATSPITWANLDKAQVHFQYEI